jgi:hypothetical protein
VQHGFCLVGWKFQGHGETRGAVGEPQFGLHRQIVALDHGPVDLERQIQAHFPQFQKERIDLDGAAGPALPGHREPVSPQNAHHARLGGPGGRGAGEIRLARRVGEKAQGRAAVTLGSSWRTDPAAAFLGLANTFSPAARRDSLSS